MDFMYFHYTIYNRVRQENSCVFFCKVCKTVAAMCHNCGIIRRAAPLMQGLQIRTKNWQNTAQWTLQRPHSKKIFSYLFKTPSFKTFSVTLCKSEQLDLSINGNIIDFMLLQCCVKG